MSRSSDFWVITSYFNPAKFKVKKENYCLFRESILNQKANLLTIEQVTETSDLSGMSEVISISGGAILWQKERLLNLAIKKLPSSCKFVAWLDSDILFENNNWIEESKLILKNYQVIQPYSKVFRLPKGIQEKKSIGESWESFSYIYSQNSCQLLNGNFDLHGHTGFAWVTHKEVIQKLGFYDACILGSGDHMMAHAFVGDWESPCIVRILGHSGKFLKHFQNWATRIYQKTQARVGFLPGTIFHLWHGETAHRKYVSRNKKLLEFQFDPIEDIILGKNGLWEWKSKKIELQNYCKNYFIQREEDS